MPFLGTLFGSMSGGTALGSLGSMFGGSGGNMLSAAGSGASASPAFGEAAKNMFGNMAGMGQQQQQAQFSPVQFGGAGQNGNDLSKLVMALMQRGQ